MKRSASRDFKTKLEIIKKAINKDMDKTRSGIVPTSIKSFSELHDYVDANEYIILAFHNKFPFNQKGYNEANKLMDAIDEWLKKGRQ